MEADLSRYYGLDLRDHWRSDADGRPRLTLRMIVVRVRYLPRDSACALILADQDSPLWSRTDELLDELRREVAASRGVKRPKPHPDRVKGKRARKHDDPDRARRRARAKARKRERDRQIEEGVIT